MKTCLYMFSAAGTNLNTVYILRGEILVCSEEQHESFMMFIMSSLRDIAGSLKDFQLECPPQSMVSTHIFFIAALTVR